MSFLESAGSFVTGSLDSIWNKTSGAASYVGDFFRGNQKTTMTSQITQAAPVSPIARPTLAQAASLGEQWMAEGINDPFVTSSSATASRGLQSIGSTVKGQLWDIWGMAQDKYIESGVLTEIVGEKLGLIDRPEAEPIPQASSNPAPTGLWPLIFGNKKQQTPGDYSVAYQPQSKSSSLGSVGMLTLAGAGLGLFMLARK